MRIVGFQKNSFIDYKGKIASVVFTPGCNFRCAYCHNFELISGNSQVEYMEQTIMDYLEKRKNFIDGLVITGGEPTLQPGLYTFIAKIKAMGISVKLDTNGYKPEVLKNLLYCGMLDYVAMDIKAPFGRYSEICRTEIDEAIIKRSIDLIRSSGVDYEFRTTLYPALRKRDIVAIAESLKGAKLFALQQYRQVDTGSEFGSNLPLNMTPHSMAYVAEIAEDIRPCFDELEVRGI